MFPVLYQRVAYTANYAGVEIVSLCNGTSSRIIKLVRRKSLGCKSNDRIIWKIKITIYSYCQNYDNIILDQQVLTKSNNLTLKMFCSLISKPQKNQFGLILI